MARRPRGVARLIGAAIALSGASLVAAVGPSSATGNNLIVNGGFESGSFTPGWTAYNFTFADSGCGAWSVSSTGEAYVPGPVYNAPVEGNYDAVESQLCPTEGILVSAPFVVPSGARLSLDFAYDNYAEDWEFDASDPFGLDYPATPNQWIRVDVIRSSAAYNTLNPSDIVSTLFDSTVGSPTFYQSWETLSASLAADAGQSLEVRISQVDNELFQPVWVDGVTLTGSLPAPANLGVTQGDGYMTATWSPVSGATSYTCTLLYGFNGPSTFTMTTTSPTCSFGGVGPYATFGVSVVDTFDGATSAPAVAFLTPKSPPPPPVTHPKAVTICEKGTTAVFKILKGAHRTCPKGYHRV